MRILENQDFVEISLRSLVADYDHETVLNLYQPIIGHQAVSVYFTLLFEGRNQKIYSLIRHETLFLKMQLSAGEFVDARRKLEAIGLLKTYYAKQSDTVIYHYDIFAPRTPSEFFDNALLSGMLIKCIGEEHTNKLKLLYPDRGNPDYGEDISAKFTDVFHPEFDDKAFAIALNNNDSTKGRNTGKIKGNFSYEIFFKCLKEISQISSDAFDKKEMKEIERLATLYGVNEEVTANHVANLYNPNARKGNHVDLEQLNKNLQREGEYLYSTRRNNSSNKSNLNNGTSALAQKINLMESKSPKEYLSYLQNGTMPATADLKIINDLSKKFGLSNSVINVIIDYTLSICNNILSRAFAEKVAASISREGITTAIDAMNYLIKVTKEKKEASNARSNKIKAFIKEDFKDTNASEDNEVSNKKDDSSSVDDESWDELLDQIDQGGSDGKA